MAEQPGAPGPSVPPAPSCDTRTGRPATLIAASRGAPGLGSASNAASPDPSPEAVSTRSHAAALDAVHPQPPTVSTWMLPRPPSALMRFGEARRSNGQGRGSCATVSRWSFTITAPVRAAPRSLAATVAVIVPSPCPEMELSCIHDASLEASHAQSRAALTFTVSSPPVCGIDVGPPLTVVRHRTSSGPITLVEVEPPHAHMPAARPAAHSDAAINRGYG